MATTQLVYTKKESILEQQVETNTNFSNIITTQEESLVFVKRLVAIGLSAITYLRVIFPEDAYKDKCIDGINLKILMDNSGCQGAETLISWTKGCFEAIEKKYLKQMTLAVSKNASKKDVALETYIFKFSYKDDGEVLLDSLQTNCKENGKDYNFEVRKPTIKMIRTILYLTESLKTVSSDVYVSMKLLYYDDVTPPDYEPPGFVPSAKNFYSFAQEPVTYKVGDVNTGFHSVKLRVTADPVMFHNEDLGVQELSTNSDDTKPSPINLDNSENSTQSSMVCKIQQPDPINKLSSLQGLASGGHYMNDLVPSLERKLSNISKEEFKEHLNSPNTPITQFATPCITPKFDDILSSNTGSCCSVRSVGLSLTSTESRFLVRCPCEVNKDQGIMILCDVCGFWQHAACFAIVSEDQAPAKHYCELCADPSSVCTDPRLCVSSIAPQIKFTCLFRRTLVILSLWDGTISSAVLSDNLGVDIAVGQSIMERLISDKCIRSGKTKSYGRVDKTVLYQSVFPKYLNKFVKHIPELTLGNSKAPLESEAAVVKNYTKLDDEPFPDEISYTNRRKRSLSRSSSTANLGSSQLKHDKENVMEVVNNCSKLSLKQKSRQSNFEDSQNSCIISEASQDSCAKKPKSSSAHDVPN